MSILSSPFWITTPSILSRSKLTTVCARRAAEQPIRARGNEIKRLLVLGQRVVLTERRVAYYDHARRIHRDALVAAAAFLDRNADSDLRLRRFLRVRLKFVLIGRVVIGFS